jgi:hypothetical protein
MVPDWFNSQSLNRYSYCVNNPLIYTDPSGHVFEGVDSDPSDYDIDYNGQYGKPGFAPNTHVDEEDFDDPGESGWTYDGEAFGWVDHNQDAEKLAAEILLEISLTAIPIAQLSKLRYLKVLKFWRKAPKSVLNPKQARKVQKISNIISNNALPKDFSGVAAELKGIKTGFDHITEMKQSVRGLKEATKSIKGSLNNPSLDPQARTQLQNAYDIGSSMLGKMQRALQGKQ